MISRTKQAVVVAHDPPESSRSKSHTTCSTPLKEKTRRRRWNRWREPSVLDDSVETPSMTSNGGCDGGGGAGGGGGGGGEEPDSASTSVSSTNNNVSHVTLVKGSVSRSFHHVEVDSCAQEQEARYALSARNIVDDHQLYDPTLGLLVDEHCQFFSDPSHQEVIQGGGVLFSFSCSQTLDMYSTELVMNTINLSCFDDETVENFVPHIVEEDLADFTVVIARSCYLLPNIDLGFVCDPALLSSVAYQKSCEPKSSYVWEDRNELDTFRITKPVVPFIFSITIQFRVSRVKPSDLDRLSAFLGLRVDGGLLMERTKRSKPPKEDRTRKIKSVLLYTKVPGGLYVTHLTAILQSSLPSIVAKVVHGFGAWGLTEALETAGKTRRFLDEQQQVSSHTLRSKG